MTPRKVISSVAWKNLSLRARVILQVFQSAHDGFNNGRIKMGIHQIGALIGIQNHKANSQAVAELITSGFLECVSDANHHQSKVREYRLTFIPSGAGKKPKAATHEYRDWRCPVGAKKRKPPAPNSKKSGSAKMTTEIPISVVDTATVGKFSGSVMETEMEGIDGISIVDRVALVAPILVNQSPPLSPMLSSGGTIPSLGDGGSCIELCVLRDWTRYVIELLGYGGQKVLALDAGVPQSVLCKFVKGKGLPARYHIALQAACGRHSHYTQWKTANAA